MTDAHAAIEIVKSGTPGAVAGVMAWMPVLQTLVGGILAAGVAFFVNKQTHKDTLEREEMAAVKRLQNEKQSEEEKLARERYFLATGLVFILEEFAEGCARVAADNGEDNDADQPEKVPSVNYPALNFKDTPGDWRALPALLMYRIHELPVLQNEAGRAIDNAAEHSWPPYHTTYFRERQYHYARLGLKAIIQARRLRKIAGFPDTRLDTSLWSAQPILWEVWKKERRQRATEAFENRDFCDTEFEDMAP